MTRSNIPQLTRSIVELTSGKLGSGELEIVGEDTTGTEDLLELVAAPVQVQCKVLVQGTKLLNESL